MNKKEIEGFEGYYITPEGQISRNNKVLKVQLNKKNIPFVALRKDSKYYIFTVAKLVALTFLDNETRTPSDVVAYRDGNNHNFDVSNLFWSSRSEAYSKLYNKTSRYSQLRLYNLRKKLCKPVVSMKMVDNSFTEIRHYSSIIEAATDVGVASASLMRCLKNQRNMSAGYYWKYLDREDD